MKGVSPSAWRSSSNRFAPQRLHRPVGVGQKVVQRLGVDVDGLAQPRQGLVPGLGQQPRCSAVKCSKCRTFSNRKRYWAQYWSMKATVGVAGRVLLMLTLLPDSFSSKQYTQHDRRGIS